MFVIRDIMLLTIFDNFIFLFEYNFVNLELINYNLSIASAKQIESRLRLFVYVKTCVVRYINNYFQRILFTNFDHVISKNNKFTVLLISWPLILDHRIGFLNLRGYKQSTSFRHISGLTIGHRTVTCKIVYLFIKG